MGQKYVIIINNNNPVPLRHVIEIKDSYNEEEFKSWYYNIYFKLNGDEFIYCDSHKNMINFLERLYSHEEN